MATYYVSTSGSNSNSGSILSPWRTITYGASRLSPGDTLYLRGGTYYEKAVVNSCSGNSGAYITIAAYPGETPLIDGTGYSSLYPYGLFDIRNVSFIKVDGIHVRMSTNALIMVSSCNYIEINNCFTDLSYASGIGVWWSNQVKVYNNKVKNSHYISIPAGGHEESISIAGTTNFEISYNEVYRDDEHPGQFGDLGIDCKQGSRFGTVHHNYVHDYVSEEGCGGIYVDAWDRLTGNIDVYDNYIANSSVGIDVSSEQGGTCENVRVFNNIIYNVNAVGIHLQKRPPPYDFGIRRNIQIYNNTIYKCKYNGGAGIYITAHHIENIVVRNNLVYFNGYNGEIVAGDISLLDYISCDHNIVYGPKYCSDSYPYCIELSDNPTGYPNIYGNITADPKFVSLTEPDFHLQASSPAINAGADASFIIEDFEGNARPQDGTYDIGAYEYTVGGGASKYARSLKHVYSYGYNPNQTSMFAFLEGWSEDVTPPPVPPEPPDYEELSKVMNVNVIWQQQDITHHVIEYTRQHDICTGIGSLDLIIEGSTEFDFKPWNEIVIREEDTQVAVYNITSWEKAAPDGTYIIAAQDNSKRLTDYFLDREYTSETLSKTRYWIELILSEAGVIDYSINTTSDGEPVTIGSQFGLKPAYDAILNLLQLSGWYMYFNSYGSCQIGELDTDKNPIHNFYDSTTLNVRTTYSDKMLRNRVYVWGSYDEMLGWVTATVETYLGWFRDDGQDYRSVVYQNSSIYYYSTALKMAEKILAEFSKEIPEKEIQVVGLHPNLRVGVYIRSLGKYGTGVGQVSSYIVNVGNEGATTTLIVDKRCSRLFGISDVKAQYVYIGTNDNGVWRKSLDGGYWYAYNTNIETQHVRDLAVYDKLLSAVTQNGELYINNAWAWEKYYMPSGLIDACPATLGQEISTSSGYFIATSMDTSTLPDAGITAVFSTFEASGFSFENPLPIYPASGNRSWVIGLTSDSELRYMHQISYSGVINEGKFYDVGVLDLSTNDLGHNIISIQSSIKRNFGTTDFGRYGSFGLRPVVGKDIYISMPPPTKEDHLIDDADWGGNTSLNTLKPGYIYYSPSGCDGATTIFYQNFYEDTLWAIHKEWIPAGQAYSEGETFTLYASPDIYLAESQIKRVWKIDDDTYSVLAVFTDDNTTYQTVGDCPVWAELHIDSESIDNYIQFPTRWVMGGSRSWEVPKTVSDNYVAGTDGRYVLEAHANHSNSSADDGWKDWSGCGFVRVIDLETGLVHYSEDIALEEYSPHIYGGGEGALHLEIVGGCETPNHVVVAFCVCISGETSHCEHMPWYEVYIYILNKYTGVVNKSTYLDHWRCIDEYGCDDWSSSFVAGLSWYAAGTYGFSGIEEHRNPFVICLQEEPDAGYGTVAIHLYHKIVGRKWCWGYNWMMPPYWFWGSNYMGTYWQSVMLYVDIQSAAIMNIVNYMTVHQGNADVLPVIPQYDEDTCPLWLRQGYNSEITTTYSRNVLSPVIFHSVRENTEDYSWNLAFLAPYSLDVMNFISLDMTPELYQIIGQELRPAPDLVIHPMMDDIDNTIYFTTYSGGGILFGMDMWGHIEKEYNKTYGFWAHDMPYPLANKVSTDSEMFKGFLNWPGGSGVEDHKDVFKVLYHDPTVPSGQFTTLFEYKFGMSVETGLGLPTVIYDPPVATTGWLFHQNSTVLGASWTNDAENFPTMSPNTAITEGRLLDIFQGANFPLASGYHLPDNYLSRFLGTVDSANNTVKIFNTEYEDNLDRYSVIHFFPVTYDATHVDFTNFFPSPYIFVAATNPASGQQFFQRFTEEGIFYNLSYNLPVGSLITIIRADDRI